MLHAASFETSFARHYFPGLDLVPGNLELMEFEHESPKALMERRKGDTLFFARFAKALGTVEERYDTVVIDCPPQLGYLTLSALCAATAVLITVHPQMLDVMSMCQFLIMTSDMLGIVAKAGGNMEYDWMRYLVTRFEPTDGPQTQMVGLHANALRGAGADHSHVKEHSDLGCRNHRANTL